MSSNDKVIQLTPEVVDEFKRRKLIDDVKQSDIALTPVKFGDHYIGLLNAEEAKLFLGIQGLHDQLEQYMFERKMDAREEDIKRQREKGYRHDEALTMITITLTNEQSEYFEELRSRVMYLEAMFWYNLRQRLNCFSAYLGIREGLKVVRTGWKHHS